MKNKHTDPITLRCLQPWKFGRIGEPGPGQTPPFGLGCPVRLVVFCHDIMVQYEGSRYRASYRMHASKQTKQTKTLCSYVVVCKLCVWYASH